MRPIATTVVALADRLWQAEVERAPIAPITDVRPDLTVEDAYAIQATTSSGGSRRAAWSAVARSA